MTKILFVCYGSILKSPEKASKINGFMKRKGAYYTITTPFFSEFGVLNAYHFFVFYDFFLDIFHARYVIVYVHCHITVSVPHNVL